MNRKVLFTLSIMLILSMMVSAQPAMEWATSFGSTTEDRARKITSDQEGNIYVVGYFSGTVDFDPGPEEYNLTDLGGRDAYILKLDANGNFIWVKTIGSVATDMILDITLDGEGNIYVSGYFQAVADFDPSEIGIYSLTPVGGLDAFVAKYDANGDFIWAHSFGSSEFENASSIDVDPNGDIVFCGYFRGTIDFDPGPTNSFELTSAGVNDIFICKFSSDGEFIWARGMGNTGNDTAYSLVCDDAGNIYTTGVFSGSVDFNPGNGVSTLTSLGQEDSFILKLDAAGNYMWAVKFGNTLADYGYDIGLDSDKNVYTTGYFGGTVDFDPASGTGFVYNLTSAGGNDAYFSKLDSNGVFIWAKSIGGSSDDAGFGMEVKPSGEAVYSGYFSGTVDFDPGMSVYEVTASELPVSRDIYGLKLDASGNFVYGLGVGGSGTDYGFDILEDADGMVYLAGYFSNTSDFDPSLSDYSLTSAGNLDIFVAKYNSNFVVSSDQVVDDHSAITIYPNPFSSQINISFLEEQKNSTIRITDLNGRIIKAFPFSGNQLTIDRSEMKAGIYFLIAADGTGSIIVKKKVIVQ